MDPLSLEKEVNLFNLNSSNESIKIGMRSWNRTSIIDSEYIKSSAVSKDETEQLEYGEQPLKEISNESIAQNLILIEKLCQDLSISQNKIDSELSQLHLANLPSSIVSFNTQFNELRQITYYYSESTNVRLKSLEESIGNFEIKMTSLSHLIETKISNDSLQRPLEETSNSKAESSPSIIPKNEKNGTNEENYLQIYSNMHADCISNIELRIKKLEDLITNNATQLDNLEGIIEKANFNQKVSQARLCEETSGLNEIVDQLKERVNSLFDLANDSYQIIQGKYLKSESCPSGQVWEYGIENEKTDFSNVEKGKKQILGFSLEKIRVKSQDTAEEAYNLFDNAYLEFSELIRLT